MEIQIAAKTNDILGEVPIWDEQTSHLWWTDVFRPALHRLDVSNGHVATWVPPDKIHSFALRKKGGLLIAGRKGIAFYRPETDKYSLLSDPCSAAQNTMLNDGRTDRTGAFWVGSMDIEANKPIGKIFRMSGALNIQSMADSIVLANGLATSPDGRTLYYADSIPKIIYAFDLEPVSGMISNKRVFADTSNVPGIPDGATVDSEGCLWSARFDGARVIRYAPDGKVISEIMLPVSRVTSCTFGGDDLKTLYITSALFRLSDAQRALEPMAGCLFATKVSVAGLLDTKFEG